MVYTIIVDGKSYDLPKKTIDVMTEIDTMIRIDANPNLSIREKYQRLHEFIVKIVGTENAREILGSDDLTEMDLSDMTITFQKIVTAYNKPVEDYKASQGLDALNQIPIEKIMALANVANRMNSKK